MNNDKDYLGDGVYALSSDFEIILTTENGVTVGNTIFIDPTVWRALHAFVKRTHPEWLEVS